MSNEQNEILHRILSLVNDTLQQTEAAINGDSIDAEHDALVDADSNAWTIVDLLAELGITQEAAS